MEELQKRSEALDEKDVLLQNAWRAVDQANRHKEAADKALADLITQHREEKEPLEKRLKAAKEAAVEEFRTSDVTSLTQLC